MRPNEQFRDQDPELSGACLVSSLLLCRTRPTTRNQSVSYPVRRSAHPDAISTTPSTDPIHSRLCQHPSLSIVLQASLIARESYVSQDAIRGVMRRRLGCSSRRHRFVQNRGKRTEDGAPKRKDPLRAHSDAICARDAARIGAWPLLFASSLSSPALPWGTPFEMRPTWSSDWSGLTQETIGRPREMSLSTDAAGRQLERFGNSVSSRETLTVVPDSHDLLSILMYSSPRRCVQCFRLFPNILLRGAETYVPFELRFQSVAGDDT